MKIRILIIGLGIFLGGCAGTLPPEFAEPICFSGADRALVFQQAECVLGQMHFKIDKSDLEAGIIRTRPLPAGQFFEVWRGDSVGSFNSSEANLHTIRRTVEMTVDDSGGAVCLDCVVKVERLSLSDSAGQSDQIRRDKFSLEKTEFQKLELGWSQREWIDLGTDGELAAVILCRTEKKLLKR